VVFPIGFVHSFFLGTNLYNWWLRGFWILMACIYAVVLVYRLWNWHYVRRHPLNVAEVSQETHDAWSLYFEGKHREYEPGQFMILQLVRDGKVSEPHPFTISSSPSRERLSVTVKSSGDFTSTIGDTKISDTAYVDAPYGVFTFFGHDSGHFVFIAGGIGITPFISALRYMYDTKMKRDITLIFGNKTEKDIVFRGELEKMATEMAGLKVVHVMSEQDDWSGEKGNIGAELLERHVDNLQDSQFFLCGPFQMIVAVEKTLRGLGVPKKRIHYERFTFR
jgi:predicted ferric reductase